MTILQALILSAVEGIAEFLPISSTGHMILVSDLLRLAQSDFVKTFEIFIQLGAILAVVVIYFKTLIKKPQAWPKYIVAFIPTGIIGLLSYKIVKTYLLGNTVVVLASLLIGGIALILLEVYYKKSKHRQIGVEGLTFRDAIILGLFQSLAIIPGVSRSAATIGGGLLLGLSRSVAVEFSFILAIPTMIAATGLDLIKSSLKFSHAEYLLLALGFLGAFATAIVAIKYLLIFVRSHTFIPFAIYRIGLAIVFSFWILKGGMAPVAITATSPTTQVAAPQETQFVASTSASSLELQVTDSLPVSKFRVPILTYHYIGINPNPKGDPARTGLSVTPSNLEQQFTYLKDNGYTPVTLAQLHRIFGAGAEGIKPVVLTFDDGYIDFFVNAFPIIKKFNFSVVSFIPTNLMNQGYYLSWDQIKEMARSGLVEFDDHSADHIDLRKLSYAKIKEELQSSRAKLQGETGQPVDYVAYPYGAFNTVVLTAASDAGFLGGVTTVSGDATSNSLTMPRLEITGYATLASFAAKLR